MHRGDVNTTIRFPAADTFAVETAGSERMRIDSNGRLLVGVNTSTGEDRIFQIVGTTSDSSSAQLIRHSADTAGSKIDFTKSRANIGSNTVLQAQDGLGDIVWRGDDGTDLNSEAAKISAVVDGTPGTNDMPGRLTFWTSADGSASPTERMRIISDGRLLLGTTNASAYDSRKLTVAAASGGCGIEIRSSTSDAGQISFSDGYAADATAYRGYIQYQHNTDTLSIASNSSTALTINSSQNATFAGTVSDSKGNLRSIPKNAKTSAYTAVAADAGKAITISSGGVTVPNGTFSEGDALTIINDGGSAQTITQGSGLTIFNAADASSGNRTLAGRGMCSLYFLNGSYAYISGAGLS